MDLINIAIYIWLIAFALLIIGFLMYAVWFYHPNRQEAVKRFPNKLTPKIKTNFHEFFTRSKRFHY